MNKKLLSFLVLLTLVLATMLNPSIRVNAEIYPNAKTITFDRVQTYYGFSTPLDSYYKFDLKAGQAIAVMAESDLDSTSTTWGSMYAALCDKNGNMIAKLTSEKDKYGDYNIPAGERGVVNYIAPASGTYYLNVRINGDVNFTGYCYDLAIYNSWINPGVNCGNYNFSPYTAKYIDSQQHQISSLGKDFYRFTAKAGSQVKIIESSQYENYSLYDSNFKLVYDFSSTNITYTVPVTSAYILKVTGKPGWLFTLSNINFDEDKDTDGDGLSDAAEYVRKTDPLKADTDGDNSSDYNELINGKDPLIAAEFTASDLADATSRNYAKAVPINKEFAAEKTSYATWYKVSLKAGESLNIEVKPKLTAGVLWGTVLDEAGREFAEIKKNKDSVYADLLNGDTAYTTFQAPVDGTYYVCIDGDSAANGKYSLGLYKSWYNAGEIDSNREFYSTFDTAKYIEPGRHLLSRYGVDFYRFTAKAGATISIKQADLTRGYISTAIYDQNQNAISWFQGNIFTVPVTGTYYYKVTGGGGEYDLSIDGIESDKDTDGDKLYDAAEYVRGTNATLVDTDGDGTDDYTEIVNGIDPLVGIELSASSVANADYYTRALAIPVINKEFSAARTTKYSTYYKVDLKAGEGIFIVEKSMLISGALQAVVLDKDGNEVAKLINKENSSLATMSNSQTGIVSYTAPKNGTYYIEVYGDGYGKYKLALYKNWLNVDEIDSNRNFYSSSDTAKYIETGRHSLSGYGSDVYRFTASGGSTISITAKPYLTSGQMYFKIFDSKGNSAAKLLCSTRSSGDYLYNGEIASVSYKVPMTGTYFLSVSGDPGDYDLSFNGIAPDKDTDGDKLYDAVEYTKGTDPALMDTDGDGSSDYEELIYGKDPRISVEIDASSVAKAATLASALAVPVINKEFSTERITSSDTWYKVELKAGESISIVEKSELTSGKLQVSVMNGEGNEVAKLENYKSSGYYYMSNLDYGTAYYEAIKSGIYYIKVFGDGYGKYNLGLYKNWMNASVDDSSRTFYSTFGTARYAVDGRYSRSSYGSEIYRFTAKAGAKISIAAKAYSITGKMDFYLYDGKFQRIYNKTDRDIYAEPMITYLYNGEGDSMTYTVPLTGTYFLLASGEVGEYELSFTGIDAEEDTDKDKLSNASEYMRGTNPASADSDGDGVNDYTELLNGNNPRVRVELQQSDITNATSRAVALTIPATNEEFAVEKTTGSSTWYKTTLKAGQNITVSVKAKYVKGYFQAIVYDAKGYKVADLTDPNRANFAECIYSGKFGLAAYTAPADGVYYLEVRSEGYSKYNLSVYDAWYNEGTTDNSRNFYSTFETAQKMTLGRHSLSEFNIDYYRVDLTSGTSVKFAVTAFTTEGAVYAQLYDKNKKLIKDFTDIKDPTYKNINYLNGTMTAAFTVPTTDTYYIKVYGAYADYYLSYSNEAPKVTSVNCSGDIKINFSEPITRGSDFGSISVIDGTGAKIDISTEIVDNSLIIKLSSGFEKGSRYTVTIMANGINNIAGAAMSEEYSFTYVAINADLNNDGRVNIQDLALDSDKYNMQEGNANWDANYDINGDNIIDIFDLVLIAASIE